MSQSVNRRTFLKSAAVVLGTSFPYQSTAAPNKIVAGAIRWDAWYRDADNSVFAQRSLGPQRYHLRAPIHCQELSVGTIKCIGSQSVIDAEIRAAARSGLKFWAFDWYSESSSFRVAWNLYQASSLRGLINWCGIVPLPYLSSGSFESGQWLKNIAEWTGYMSQSHYQKVSADGTSGRPLLFIYYRASELMTHFDGSNKKLAVVIRKLREEVTRNGVANPYIVVFDPTAEKSIPMEIGANAISNYIGGFRPKVNGSFAELDAEVQAYWSRLSASGLEIVPIAQVGWDIRPRIDNPVPWEQIRKPEYYNMATPAEFASHLKAAATFINNNSRSCASNLVLIYSWDECDEGGCILPTLGDPSGIYLKAISQLLSM